MRRLLLLLLLVSPVIAQGQTTTTTGTIVDGNGNPYSNGTASAQKAVASGQVQPPPVNVTTNGSGTFSMTLPSPASYIFTICAPPTQIGPTGNPTPTSVCFNNTAPVAISGASQDVSSSLNAVAKVLGPNITGVSGVVATCTANQVPFYAVNGNVVACSSVITISGVTATVQNEVVTGTDTVGVLSVGSTATVTGALAANGGATVNNGVVVNGGSALNGGGSDSGAWTHAGNHTFNGATNRANGALTSTSRFSANNLNDMLLVDGITNTNIATAVTAAGASNSTMILIPSTYSGTECPALQNNLFSWDFRAGGRVGSGNSSFICTNNMELFNTKTPGLTDTLFRSEMTRNAVDATGSIVSRYIITHLLNATVTGGVIDGASTQGEVDGTLFGTLNGVQGNESVAAFNSTGGTVTTATGTIGYISTIPSSTTLIINAWGLEGLGCRGTVFGIAPTNCYGGFFRNQLGTASGRNYAAGFEGRALFQWDGNVASGGFDLENNVHVVKPFLNVDNSNNTILQAIDANGMLLQDVSGGNQLQVKTTGVRIATSFNIGGGITTAAPLNGNTGFQHLRVTGCATAAALNATCDTTFTWTSPFANASYTATCTGEGVTSGVPIVEGAAISGAKSGTAMTVRTLAITAAAAQFAQIDCTAVHD